MSKEAFEIDLNKPIDPFNVWDQRAKIPGLRSVMSLGLNETRAQIESEKLIAAVFSFLESDLFGKDVLELGTGIGRFTKKLSQQSSSLTTIDLSQLMLNRARLNCNGAQNLNFVRASGDHIPIPDNTFDWVFEVTVLEHMPDVQFGEILAEAKRVLKPEGKVFLCGPIAPNERQQIHQYAVHRKLEEYQQALAPLYITGTENVKCGDDCYTMLLAS